MTLSWLWLFLHVFCGDHDVCIQHSHVLVWSKSLPSHTSAYAMHFYVTLVVRYLLNAQVKNIKIRLENTYLPFS